MSKMVVCRAGAAALTLALSLAAGSAAWAQTSSLTEAQVTQKLQEQGYTSVHEIKFDDGIWKADARSADGNRVDVRIDPTTGAIHSDEDVSRLSEQDVRASLAGQGYTNVRDVAFKHGVWNAEAEDPAGKDVEARMWKSRSIPTPAR